MSGSHFQAVRAAYQHLAIMNETIIGIATMSHYDYLFPQYKRITTYPSGLYLHSTSTMRAEDECLFLLPSDMAIGRNGFAKKTDGSRFGQRRRGEDSHTDFYRPGYQPFEEHHEHNLAAVLGSWRGMVESGNWGVDDQDVAGGTEVWREADTEEGWEKYVIASVVEGDMESERT
jgi:hypothetical protein